MSKEKPITIARRDLIRNASIVAGGIGAAVLLSACSEDAGTGTNSSQVSDGTKPTVGGASGTAKREVTWVSDPGKCVGCGDCNFLCPAGVLEVVDMKSERTDPDNCLGCGLCMKECWQSAIDVVVYW